MVLRSNERWAFAVATTFKYFNFFLYCFIWRPINSLNNYIEAIQPPQPLFEFNHGYKSGWIVSNRIMHNARTAARFRGSSSDVRRETLLSALGEDDCLVLDGVVSQCLNL